MNASSDTFLIAFSDTLETFLCWHKMSDDKIIFVIVLWSVVAKLHWDFSEERDDDVTFEVFQLD